MALRGVNWRFYYLKKSFAPYPAPPGAGGRVAAPAVLNRYYQDFDRRRTAPRRLLDKAITAAFPLWARWRARVVARRFGLSDDWARRAARIAAACFADPREIALYEAESAADMAPYIRLFEHDALVRLIEPQNRDHDTGLADKRLFQRICMAHDLPTPQLFATCDDSAVTVHALPAADMDLCVKPAHATGGIGVEMCAAGAFPTGDAAAFADWLRRRFGTAQNWLAQARVVNHPTLTPIALDAVCTARITTMRDETGAPEIVGALLRLAAKPGIVVDNAKAGGLIAPIDRETGVLGPARTAYAPGLFHARPETGAEIDGRPLPFWRDATALALRAHAQGFAGFTMIGWDIALTPDGPVLLEGNTKPGLIIAQRVLMRGLGDTRHGALIAHHVDRALAARDG